MLSTDGKMITVERTEGLEKEAVTWTTVIFNRGSCSQGPASNLLGHGTAFLIGTKIVQLMEG
jgi:hypothetical protein